MYCNNLFADGKREILSALRIALENALREVSITFLGSLLHYLSNKKYMSCYCR